MNKNKIIFVFLFASIMLLTLVGLASADTNTYAVSKQYECTTIKQTCASCSYVNVSVSYPNSTMVVTNDAMISEGGGLWTYEFCNTSQTGRYDVSGIGDLLGIPTTFDVLSFEVNPTGHLSSSFLNNPIFIVLIFIGLALVLFGAFEGIPWFGFIGSVMFLLLGVYTMIYGFDNLTNMYTQGTGIVLLGMGFIFMFTSAYEWMADSGEESVEQ